MNNNYVQPFLKWAGGKSQLLDKIKKYFPATLINGQIDSYFEPFLGAGAVFFHIAQHYQIKNVYLSDINPDLILAYKVIRDNPATLLDMLGKYKKKYFDSSPDEQKSFYYELRTAFNKNSDGQNFSVSSSAGIDKAAQLIFLNKTCYNGLFRVNKKGEFNVPHGRYKNPQIFSEEKILKVSKLLSNADIQCADFSKLLSKADSSSFIYLDPPYRPISKTAIFTSYSGMSFDDTQQLRLAKVIKGLHQKGAKIMLSNSDPKNEDSEDNFFDNLYRDYNIYRVNALRNINSNPNKRGNLFELIITNYSLYR